MKIKNLHEYFIGEFITLMEVSTASPKPFLSMIKNDDNTYDIEIDLHEHQYINVLLSYANQNDVIVLTFMDTRPHQHAYFSPITINLTCEDYSTIELS